MLPDPSTPTWLARRFVVCALSLGVLYTFINPPLAVNDERHHLARAYELSFGEPWARVDEGGAYFEGPVAYSSLVKRYGAIQGQAKERLDPYELLADLSSHEGLYESAKIRTRIADQFPIVYLPQAPAIWLARALGLPALWHIYFARLSTLAASALLLGWAVSKAGRLCWVFAALGLMPMTLTEISGVSSNAAIIALSFVFFALLAQCSAPEEPPINAKQRGALLCLFVLLVLCKPSSMIFALALPAVRRSDASDSRRTHLAYAGLALLLGAAVALAWTYAQRSFLEQTLMNPAREQALWILAHPLATLKAWGRGIFREIDDYVIQLIVVRDILSRQMRFSAGVIATLYVELLLMLAIGALHLPKEARAQRRESARWLTATSAAYSIAIFALVYLTANDIGAPNARGMQGRFLLPVAPAIFGAIATRGHPIGTRWLLHKKGARALTVIICLNILCLLALIGRYYAPFEHSWPY
jgi:uncharacterized membrane protein